MLRGEEVGGAGWGVRGGGNRLRGKGVGGGGHILRGKTGRGHRLTGNGGHRLRSKGGGGYRLTGKEEGGAQGHLVRARQAHQATYVVAGARLRLGSWLLVSWLYCCQSQHTLLEHLGWGCVWGGELNI